MISSSPVHVVGLSVSGSLGTFGGVGVVMQEALASSGHPSGLPIDPLAKRSALWLGLAGKPQRVSLTLARGVNWVMSATVKRRP